MTFMIFIFLHFPLAHPRFQGDPPPRSTIQPTYCHQGSCR